MSSSEKVWVLLRIQQICTPPVTNPQSMGFSGYQNINSSSQRDNYLFVYFRNCILEAICFREFFIETQYRHNDIINYYKKQQMGASYDKNSIFRYRWNIAKNG